ncbi:MAG: hypothetical protein EHM59_03895 [Betaproteobacteria bacterium]|nr:MAG: hypothetical protein EHM59_03895 [Betaproteobacteria bacterium]
MVFGFSQVVIDIEPLVAMIRGSAVLRGFTHTYMGATLIGLGSVIIGRPIYQFLLGHFRPDPRSPLLNRLFSDRKISWSAAITGAFVGTYSHDQGLSARYRKGRLASIR